MPKHTPSETSDPKGPEECTAELVQASMSEELGGVSPLAIAPCR